MLAYMLLPTMKHGAGALICSRNNNGPALRAALYDHQVPERVPTVFPGHVPHEQPHGQLLSVERERGLMFV